ncbi:MAG: hypothetical protein DI551_02120 [Micavibrio aeruginosavorus]|uniref:Lipoprotein n=1 Tax=Micavibrio aeruginosavorus TaxID=349221 RepID=A0A2W5Q9L6_9BACT|nr:MAG: hypothetical protein DI551_02120 [Micavibrio aeruginosavorus]
MKKILLGAAAVALLGAGACTINGAKPAPQLSFANYQPVTLNVMSADVVESFNNANDAQDVSSQFVITPAEAVRRYAGNRWKASGSGDGTFTIVIEDSRVHVRQIPQNNKVLKWADAGTEDEYHVYLGLRVTPQPSGFNGRMGPTTIKMDRTLVMPSSVTLEEREMRQVAFLEKLIADVDVRINDAVNAAPAIRN